MQVTFSAMSFAHKAKQQQPKQKIEPQQQQDTFAKAKNSAE